jgi:hypothetical protein
MHVKITASGPRCYVQLVESFRDDQGRIRKRTVATLGRLDQVGGSLDAVINGLLKATGRAPVLGADAQPKIQFEPARALGEVWALHERKRPVKYILPPFLRRPDDGTGSSEREVAAWVGGSAVGASGSGWWPVGVVAA